MDYKEITDKIKPEMEKVLGFLQRELAKIRTSRASPSLVEDIIVDCFGQKLPLKQVGTISLAGVRQIVIQPWDNSYIEEIEKAISRSNLAVSVSREGEVIRLSLPPLSEEYRQNLFKILSEKMEEARKTIRHWRASAWKEVQQREKTGEVREDDKYRAKDALQDLIDDYNGKIEELGENKKREIME